MKLVFATVAKDDVRSIWNYIAQDSTLAADRVIDQIEHTAGLLLSQPKMGRIRPDLQLGLRSFPCKPPYTIYYRLEPEQLRVMRVLHQSRDITRLFS